MATPMSSTRRREQSAADQIPYTRMVDSHVLRTAQGAYVQAMRLSGASFDTAEDAALDNWHERLNVLWRNLASPEVSLWTHLLRRPVKLAGPRVASTGFEARLAGAYRERLASQLLLQNELYLSIVYVPEAGRVPLSWRLARRQASAHGAAQAAALEHCAKLRDLVRTALERYEPKPLGLLWRGRTPHSQLLEWLALLVNGEYQPLPLPRAPVNEVLATSRLLFGRETIEYRSASGTLLGAMLGIKEYPTPTVPGLLNACLATPFPLVLTQSFSFLSRGASLGLLQRQVHRMTNAGDLATSQIQELRGAMDQIASNAYAMGEHHCSLQVLSERFDQTDPRIVEREFQRLNERVALARSLLSDAGMVAAREDLALEPAFWAQLPGLRGLRPRRAVITTRNFAALAPFHNYPTGSDPATSTQDALALLTTVAHTPYRFSLRAAEVGSQTQSAGHTFLCGPTGCGKTVFIAFLIASLKARGATQVIFDKDHGLEILVRALGGTYRPLANGECSGCNPLQLEQTPANMEFLRQWLHSLVGPQPLSAAQAQELEQALLGTMALERRSRRLSRLIEFLDTTAQDGPYRRLCIWTHATQGACAWVFDNPQDEVAESFGASETLGFDLTDVLQNAQVRTPLTLYLFHLVRQLLDGRALVCWLDEFWRLLDDPAFMQFAKDGPKTWRKLNAVMCLATQSPSDVLQSPISRTIVEQTPTKIFFPNPQAQERDYVAGFGLTGKEFHLVRTGMDPAAREFLVSQGSQRAVCRLDLTGLEAELAVLATRIDTRSRMLSLISTRGSDPRAWLDAFLSPSSPNTVQGDLP